MRVPRANRGPLSRPKAIGMRLGRPRVTSGPVELLESPALATGVGLIHYAHREAETRRAEPRRSPRVLPLLGRLLAWVKNLFSS